jgi:ubiquinone/menaquinone biosynthesis C-methylase UbiE
MREEQQTSLQREHFDEFAETYEGYLQRSSFWRSHDSLVTARWIGGLAPGTDLIDVGAGTGRCLVPIAERLAPGSLLLGVDLSFEVLRVTADRLKARGLEESVHLAVGDCRELSFVAPQSFAAAFLYDLLHHLDEKATVFTELARLLRPGSTVYLRDNNASALRSVFDFLMRFWRLWEAEHEGHPVVSMPGLRDWAQSAGFEVTLMRSSVFLPPHVFDLLPLRAAGALLRVTEWIGRRVPWLSRNGGMIVATLNAGPGGQR